MLTKIELFGLGGVAANKLFHQHEFDYSHTLSDTPFGTSVEPWRFVDTAGTQAQDDRAISASADFAVGAHVYVGIGPGPMKETGSAGLRVGLNHREGATEAILMDVNGDSLPDRLTEHGVELNGGADRLMSPLAPYGDPYSGAPVFGVGAATGLKALGSESGDSFDMAAQAQYGSFAANLGYTYTTTTSREFLTDADGDGLVDYVGPGEVLFNQQRTQTCTDPAQCCPAGKFCFRPDKTVATAPALAGTGGLLEGDAQLDDLQQQVSENFHPTDALIEWTAPYEGKVDVSGVLAWVTPHPTAVPKRDGVRLRIYLEAEQKLELVKDYADNAEAPVQLTGLAVGPRQRIYFLVSTRQDFPVNAAAGQPPVPIEEVSFHPTIRYTECSGACGALAASDPDLIAPTGAPLFAFRAADDFRLAGDPMSAVLVPRDGNLRLKWKLTKSRATSDEVRLCVQKYAIDAEVKSRPCATGDLMPRTFAWDATTSGDEQTFELRANAGDQLIFRVESDVSFDPGAIASEISGEMYEVCTATGCSPPTADFPAPTFVADPYLALHDRIEAVPLRPFVAPRAGTLVIRSSNAGTLGGPVFFTARSPGRVLMKQRGAHDVELRLPVAAGEQVLFEAHSEQAALGAWNLQVGMERPAADGGLEVEWLSAPRHRTWDESGDLKSAVVAGTSPFGGGYHGWRYGLWGGRDDEAFDPAIFSAEVETPEGTDEEKMNESLDHLDDPNSAERKRARLFAPLLPRRLGTHVGDSIGLHPDAPAFVSQDGNTFITASTMHGARKGGFVQSGGGSASVAAAFDMPDMMRSSIGHTVTGGLSVGPLSLSVSGGVSNQKIDVVDMNGDRIVDVVTGSQARLTHLKSLNLRKQVPIGSGLRSNYDLSANAGLGLSDAIRALSPHAGVRAVAGMFPSIGGGIGVNLSATANDLVDVNGDGLPDQVRRSGDAFKVRLNLGTSFATAEDDLPVGYWPESGTFDPFISEVQGSGILGGSGGRSKEAESRGKIADAVQLLSSADVVRRASTVTLQANAGVMLNESFGVSANWETSLGATAVAFVDVTGDGLPDYVRKSSRDKTLRVKVNRGYGFDPVEKVWTLPKWPENADPAFVLGLFSALDHADAVKNVLPKVLGPEKADGVESTGTHSALPSVGFVVTVPIPLSPFMTPWLHLSGGADVQPRRVSGFELGFMDLNGDGVADHVLKTERGGSSSTTRAEAIYARINHLGGANLLTTVRRPLGAKLTLAYARTRNTVDLPESRFTLSQVTVEDGLSSGHRARLHHPLRVRRRPLRPRRARVPRLPHREGARRRRQPQDLHVQERPHREQGAARVGGVPRRRRQALHRDRQPLRHPAGGERHRGLRLRREHAVLPRPRELLPGPVHPARAHRAPLLRRPDEEPRRGPAELRAADGLRRLRQRLGLRGARRPARPERRSERGPHLRRRLGGEPPLRPRPGQPPRGPRRPRGQPGRAPARAPRPLRRRARQPHRARLGDRRRQLRDLEPRLERRRHDPAGHRPREPHRAALPDLVRVRPRRPHLPGQDDRLVRVHLDRRARPALRRLRPHRRPQRQRDRPQPRRVRPPRRGAQPVRARRPGGDHRDQPTCSGRTPRAR